jgi:nucleotide-binding universal stress UspA family protein
MEVWTMARTILVPLDGSEAAETILPHVFRVLPAGGKIDLIQLCPEKDSLKATAYLAKVRQRTIPPNCGIDLVRPGTPADGILRAALEKNIDLIAMTTHARKGLPRHLLGSVAAEVVRESQLPVLLTRPDIPAPATSVRKILVPIDTNQQPSGLLATLKFLCPDRAEVILLRVKDPQHDPTPLLAPERPMSYGTSPEQILQEMADKLEDEGFYAWPVTSVGKPQEEILAQGVRLGVDLIAMSTHSRAGLERLFEGSVSEGVLHRSPVAVLLQKPLVLHQRAVAP